MPEKAMAPHSSVLAWKIPGTGGAWWAAVYGVTWSWTRLKRLSSSSSSRQRHTAVHKSMATREAERLSAAPFRGGNALTVPQVQWEEGSFPPSFKASVVSCLCSSQKEHTQDCSQSQLPSRQPYTIPTNLIFVSCSKFSSFCGLHQYPNRKNQKSVLVPQSCLTLFGPWTVAHQALLSMGFSRQEHRSGWPSPSPGDFREPGMEPGSPALQADSLPSESPGKPPNGPKGTESRNPPSGRMVTSKNTRQIRTVAHRKRMSGDPCRLWTGTRA